MKNLYIKLDNVAKVNFKYVAVRKRCVTEEVKISYNKLKTIVDMANDYIVILNDKIESFEDNDYYRKLLFSLKAKEIQEISELIAGALQYNPSCTTKKKRNKDIRKEVGLDPLHAMTVLRR